MFHKEGYKIITGTFFICAVLSLSAHFLIENELIEKGLILIFLFFLILVLQFFRNPKRNTVFNDHNIIAPVDGKVVVIEEVFEPEFFKDKRIQVSIFMSPLNVHVTRYPIGGNVVFSK